MGEGQLDIYQGGGELPGVQEFGGGEDATAAALMGDNDGFFLEGKPGVELATLEEVIKEGDQDSIEEAIPAPITVPLPQGVSPLEWGQAPLGVSPQEPSPQERGQAAQECGTGGGRLLTGVGINPARNPRKEAG